jgi:hypothetical protein
MADYEYYIKKIVDQAPALAPEQVSRLRMLLNPTGAPPAPKKRPIDNIVDEV